MHQEDPILCIIRTSYCESILIPISFHTMDTIYIGKSVGSTTSFTVNVLKFEHFSFSVLKQNLGLISGLELTKCLSEKQTGNTLIVSLGSALFV